ncbi:MAG: aminopeptidase, partial [Nitrospinota bacterium]
GVTSELARLYASDLPRAEKLELREILFQGSRRKLLSAQDQYHYPNFVAFYTRARINNAFLVSLQTYTAEVETFVEAYERHGRDLAKTVAFFKTVGRLADDPAAYVRRWLEAGSVKAAAPPGSTL